MPLAKLNIEFQGATALQKNRHHKGSLRWASWIIAKLGGWSKVNDDLFDPTKGKIAKIFQNQGKSTGG